MKLIYSLIAVLITLGACTGSSCACTPPVMNEAVVWGQVTIDTGGHASGAAMFALATPTGVSCVQNTLTAWGHADSLGRFRLAVFGAGVGDSGCVFVGALFPPTLAGKDTVLGPFRLRFQPDPPFDSVNVNIVLHH
jgi:hypothetical protein